MNDDRRLTTPDAAQRPGLEPEDIYRLLFDGELEGGPGADGIVRVSEGVIAEYAERQSRV